MVDPFGSATPDRRLSRMTLGGRATADHQHDPPGRHTYDPHPRGPPCRRTSPAYVNGPSTISQSHAQAARSWPIVMEPSDFPFGERQCSVPDPWGHHWTFSQTIADMAPEDWSGETIDAW